MYTITVEYLVDDCYMMRLYKGGQLVAEEQSKYKHIEYAEAEAVAIWPTAHSVNGMTICPVHPEDQQLLD